MRSGDGAKGRRDRGDEGRGMTGLRGKEGSQYFFNAREKPVATFKVIAREGMGEEWRCSKWEEEERRGI